MKALRWALGAVSLLGVASVVVWEWGHARSPGPLHPTHLAIASLQGQGSSSERTGCAACHGASPADMPGACAACHQDVDRQIATGKGLHGSLGRESARECASCHREHSGSSVELVSQRSFEAANVPDPSKYAHQHAEAFALEGAHARLACERCHANAYAAQLQKGQKRFLGLSQACATCHEDSHKGSFGGDCASCHGQAHDFKEAPGFTHTTAFALEGVHARVACERCHAASGATSVLASLSSHPQARACAACHEDAHQGTLGTDCASCHGTGEPFDRAANFRHTPAFPLTGSHAAVACKSCHEKSGERSVASLQRTPLPARACADCHTSPHAPATLAAFARELGAASGRISCIGCHEPAHKTFRSPDALMTADLHRATGFALSSPHERAACADCHARPAMASADEADTRQVVFARAFPGRSADSCASCHQDAHHGQFDAGITEGRCAECHAGAHFKPSTFDAKHHAVSAFPLTGAHMAVGCDRCHARTPEGMRFVPTPSECVSCHTDVHQGAFDRAGKPALVDGRAGCARCHSTSSFDTISWGGADHALWTGYPLKGAHAVARCTDCHARRDRPDASGRTLATAPTRCDACHADPHAGQFARAGATDCARCHSETQSFSRTTFDHQRDSRFALDAQHASLECAACHRAVNVAPGQSVVRFRPLGTSCQDCHDPKALSGGQRSKP